MADALDDSQRYAVRLATDVQRAASGAAGGAANGAANGHSGTGAASWQQALAAGQPPPPVVAFKLNKELLARLQSNPNIDLTLDLDALTLDIGSDHIQLMHNSETSAVECYRLGHGGRDGTGPADTLSFVGDVRHKLFVKPSSMGGNERIKSLTNAERQAKAERSVVYYDDGATGPSKSGLSKNARPGSGPGIVGLGAGLGMGSAGSASSASKKNGIAINRRNKPPVAYTQDTGLRRKLIHFLAPAPQKLDAISKKFKLPEASIMAELNKIAKPQLADSTSFQLLSESYRELAPYEWTNYTPLDREKAIKNANIALDSLGVAKDAPERRRLAEPVSLLEQQQQLQQLSASASASSSASLSTAAPTASPTAVPTAAPSPAPDVSVRPPSGTSAPGSLAQRKQAATGTSDKQSPSAAASTEAAAVGVSSLSRSLSTSTASSSSSPPKALYATIDPSTDPSTSADINPNPNPNTDHCIFSSKKRTASQVAAKPALVQRPGQFTVTRP
ncbi:hypothetical protein BC831DRAFT_514778 [Entophlyctis helioformis]|nr:hypothetical protein BC831DRAFT_514778 [Entophlyctis helioformis]